MADKEQMRLKLRKPIKVLGDDVHELVFREPVAGDLWDMKIRPEGMAFGDLLEIAARLAGVPVKDMKQLHPRDAMEAVGVIGPFLL